MLLLNKYSFLVVIFLGFGSYICESQNLIQNESFESYNNPVDCFGGGGFFNYSVFPNTRVVSNWDVYHTPDYFTSICTNTYTGSPENRYGYCNSKSGIAYIGVAPYQKGSEAKEYIYQQLSSPLQSGSNYCIGFYVSRSERSTYATKNLEVCFSPTVLSMPNGYYINASPQITKQISFVTDTSNWINIHGCFTAQGGEQYVTIGNFNSNANTDTLFIGTNNPIPSYGDFSYYYIDDIELIDQLTVGLNEVEKENSFEVYPNPAKDNLTLTLSKGEGICSNCKIIITDILGKEIVHEVYKEQIDISHLEKGIYFISLYQNDHLLETKKVVKE